MSVAYDVAVYLQQQALATPGTDLGVNAFLDKADNESGVFEYAGPPDDMAMGPTPCFENPRVQVQVRNTSAETGYTKCKAIYDVLRVAKDLTLNGNEYTCLKPLRSPTLLSRDEKNRPTWICEVEVQRRPGS